MNIQHSKNHLTRAVMLALGISGATTLSADPVATWQLLNFDNDAFNSDFAFFGAPSGSGANQFAAGASGDGVAFATDGTTNDTCAVDPVICMSTGFNFGGTGIFEPNVTTGGVLADIEIDKLGSLTLSFTALNFGGVFPAGGTQFFLAPDSLTPGGSGGPPGGPGDGVLVETLTNQGGGVFGETIRYVGTINDPGGSFHNFPANWRLEGNMTVTDQAPRIFINGNPGGDIPGDATVNVAPNMMIYIDAGAVCQDVVDGEIAVGANFTTTDDNINAPNTGPAGSTFSVVYQCTDSRLNVATATRTVNAGADIEPPVITLGVGTVEPGRSDSADGSVVEILVGKPYVDVSATCIDNRDGAIALGSVAPPNAFSVTPNPPNVPTTAESPGNIITFSCNDEVNNGPTVVTRTVNVRADNEFPVVTPIGANPLTVSLGSLYTDPRATCTDTNPVDVGVVEDLGEISGVPATIDTSVEGTTTVNYSCTDAAGNTTVVPRDVTVILGTNYRVISMTISDVEGSGGSAGNDGVAGCFRFHFLDSVTCTGANLFSSDGTAALRLPLSDTTGQVLSGVGTDLDGQGNPIGIRFGVYQPITQYVSPPEFGKGLEQPVGPISPGFNFNGFPFVPQTVGPPLVDSPPPRGFVTIDGSTATLTIESLPFSGIWNSGGRNFFILDPPGPGEGGQVLQTRISVIGPDNGTTRTFNYFMTWSHIITPEEDPTGAFNNFNAFWRLEGVIMADSVPFVVNARPQITSASAQQDGRSPTAVITSNGGLVTASVMATDADTGDTLSYDWSMSPVVAADGVSNQPGFTFSPADLAQGPLALQVVVTDDNATNPLSAQREIILNVESSAPALDSGTDSNGNGVDDATEGFADTDNDGISDYQDAVDGTPTANPERNRIDYRDPARGDIVTDVGRVVLGPVAQANNDGTFVVSENTIQQFGGPGATPASNYHDRLNDVQDIGPVPDGIRDFAIEGVPVGGVARIVIPQDQPMPVLPVYRKYSSAGGWQPFARTGSNNTVASARKFNGVCPGPTDAVYDTPVDSSGRTFMEQGHECVRLTIIDGGSNDTDATKNGIVADPGTVSSNGPVSGATSSNESPFSGAGGCVLKPNLNYTRNRPDWGLILLLVTALGINSRLRSRRKVKEG